MAVCWHSHQPTTRRCKTAPSFKEGKSSQYLTASTQLNQVLKKSFIHLRIQTIHSQEKQVNSKSGEATLEKHPKFKDLLMIRPQERLQDKPTDSHSTLTVPIIKNNNKGENCYLNMDSRKSYKARGYLRCHLHPIRPTLSNLNSNQLKETILMGLDSLSLRQLFQSTWGLVVQDLGYPVNRTVLPHPLPQTTNQ